MKYAEKMAKNFVSYVCVEVCCGGSLLVRRPKTSCRTVRSMAWVGVAEGSPTPKPVGLEISRTVFTSLTDSWQFTLQDRSGRQEPS